MPELAATVDPLVFALAVAAVAGGLLVAVALRPAWVVRSRWAVVVGTALLSLAAAAALVDPARGALRLRFDASTEPLLPASDPLRDDYRQAVLEFGDDEIFVVAVRCDDVFTADCLGAIEAVSDEVAHIDGVRSVSSLIDVTSFRWVAAEDWVEVRPFIEEIPAERAALEELRQRALADPVYRKTLVAEDSRAAALNIRFRDMSDADFLEADLDGQVVAVLERAAGDGLAFHVAGRPHVKARIYHGLLDDLRLLIPLGIAVMGVVLWIVTGTRRGVAGPLFVALLANLWTFGAIAFLDRELTLLTGLLGPTLLAIGSVYGVHVMARYEEEAALAGSPPEAVLAALRHLRLPVGVAGLTTVVGFGALLISDVPAVVELGGFSVFGVAAITVLSLTGLPAVLALLPLRRRREHAIDRLLDRALSGLGRHTAGRSAPVLAVSAVAVVVAVAAIPRIVIDTDYLSYLDDRDPVRQDFEAVNRLLAGAVPLYVVLDGGERGAFREPSTLRAVEALQARLDGIPGVSRTQSFIDPMRMLNRALNEDDPAEERVPDTRAGASELMFMLPKSDVARFATVDHARANVVVRTGEVGSAAIRRLTADLEEAVSDGILPEGVEARVTGNAILLSRSADGIARSQPWTVGLAALAIFALISAGLGSLRLGAVAMIPNVVPVALFFGLLGLGAAPLSLPTSLIGSVALGIAIDDTAHWLVRYRAERLDGADPQTAADRCLLAVGRPIAITSAMLILGFLVVAFSEFATLREFGVLTAVTMGFCLVTDLVLLPAILVRLRL